MSNDTYISDVLDVLIFIYIFVVLKWVYNVYKQ